MALDIDSQRQQVEAGLLGGAARCTATLASGRALRSRALLERNAQVREHGRRGHFDWAPGRTRVALKCGQYTAEGGYGVLGCLWG